MAKLKEFFDYLKGLWSDNISQGADDETLPVVRRKKIMVFGIAFLLALGLWFLVNMSRIYSLDVQMPLELGRIPEDKALAGKIPESVLVSLQGEGWKLLSVYNDPPKIQVNLTRQQVDLYEQVRNQLNTRPMLNVLNVNPARLNIQLDEKVTRKVPVIPRVKVTFRDQFDFWGPPQIQPDSVKISGAEDRIEHIDSVKTREVRLHNVSENIRRNIALVKPHRLVELNPSAVEYRARVAEYTEGEASVKVQGRNVPPGKNLTFSPPTVTIRYMVPIQEYKEASNQKPFVAYVPYQNIVRDSTGFVQPNVELTNKKLNIRIRSYQPDKLSYYHVLGGS